MAAQVLGAGQAVGQLDEIGLGLGRGAGDDAGLAEGDRAVAQGGMRRRRELAGQGQALLDIARRGADLAGDLGAGPFGVEALEPGEGLGLLERADVGALEVLEQRQRQVLAVIGGDDLAGDGGGLRVPAVAPGQQAEGAPAALAGDQLVGFERDVLAEGGVDGHRVTPRMAAHHQVLQQPLGLDAGGELGDGLELEPLARVERRGEELGQRQQADVARAGR